MLFPFCGLSAPLQSLQVVWDVEPETVLGHWVLREGASPSCCMPFEEQGDGA